MSVYAPPEKETEKSINFFKKLFQTSVIIPTMYNILAGDWNCGLNEKDYLNYVDWENYRPRTREIIKNAIIEHGFVDTYTTMNEEYEITINMGYTYKGRRSTCRPSVRSRIDYFLISEALYDYVSKARIAEEELA